MVKLLGLLVFIAGLNSAYGSGWVYTSCAPSSSGPNFRHCHMIANDSLNPHWTGITGDVQISALTCSQMVDPKDFLCTQPTVLCKIWKQADHSVVCNQIVPGTNDPRVCQSVAYCKNNAVCSVGWCFEFSQGGWEVGH